MRGVPHLNFPAFRKAAAYLRSMNYEVFSPAENSINRHGYDISLDDKAGDDFEADRFEAFAVDTQFICLKAKAVAMLPGWESSPGAFAEWALAKALGHDIIYLVEEEYENFVSTSVSCPDTLDLFQ